MSRYAIELGQASFREAPKALDAIDVVLAHTKLMSLVVHPEMFLITHIDQPVVDAGIYREWWANPAVIGLMGFGLTTMATGLHNVGFWSAGPTLALGIAFGGTAQFIAGIVDLRKGSIFGGSAFTCYGAFWWSVFVLLYVQPKTGIPAGKPEELGFFLMWTLFTFGFCLAVHRVGKFLAVLFWLLFLAFVLLDGVVIGIVPARLAGWEIFIVGFIAWYIATATLVNTVNGRKVLPLS